MALVPGRGQGAQSFQVQVWGEKDPSSHLASPCWWSRDLCEPIFPSVKEGTKFLLSGWWEG